MNRREALKAALALPLVGLVGFDRGWTEGRTYVLTAKELARLSGRYRNCQFHLLEWDGPLQIHSCACFHSCLFQWVTGKGGSKRVQWIAWKNKHKTIPVAVTYTDGSTWQNPLLA